MFEQRVSSTNCDIFAVTETWLSREIGDDAIRLNNYNIARSDGRGRRGGGVACYIKLGLNFSVMKVSDSNNFEQLWLKIFVHSTWVSFTDLLVVTRECLNLLEESIIEFLTVSEDLILVGDFNFDLLR